MLFFFLSASVCIAKVVQCLVLFFQHVSDLLYKRLIGRRYLFVALLNHFSLSGIGPIEMNRLRHFF